MKLITFFLFFGLFGLGCTNEFPEKEKHLQTLVQLKNDLTEDYTRSVAKNDTKSAKMAKDYLELVAVYYTRIEFYNSTISLNQFNFLYNQMMDYLKTNVEKFLKDRSKYLSFEMLKLNKKDNFEYEMNVLRVMLDRIERHIKKRIEEIKKEIDFQPQHIAETLHIDRGRKEIYDLDRDQKLAEHMSLLVDSALIETRIYNPMDGCIQEHIRNKTIELIKKYSHLNEIKEIDNFEALPKEDKHENFYDLTGTLYELSGVTSRVKRLMMDYSAKGMKNGDSMQYKEQIGKIGRHLMEVKEKLEKLMDEEKELLSWYVTPTNSAEIIIGN